MDSHSTQILTGLNAPQRAAVVSESPRLLVLAGAGSGKTRVLTHRIAWAIEHDCISPHSVLAVTFTNKAAAEMRARLEKLIGVSASGMWVGTFHGIAHRLLRHHWEDAKLPQNFQILDADDQLRMVKRAHKALDLDDEKWPPKQSTGVINAWKDEGLRPQHIEASDFFSQTLKKVYEYYQELCERAGSVDFNELLLRALELWRDNDHLRAHYQNRFKLILVDEFQDTNTIQYAWLQLLACQGNKITIVGDDDQSIYGWRGAKIENIQQFHQDFVGAEIIRLEQNYRSTGTILKAANAVIAQNNNRLGKQLWTQGSDGETISVYAGFNEVDEARFIVDRVRDISLKGHARAEIAVLYRSNAQSRVLEEAFLRAQIPYRIYGGQRFFERAEIKNALAYLRLLENRYDDAAFERVVNLPTRGNGEKTLDLLRAQARQHRISLWQSAQNLIQLRMLASRAANALQAFLNLIEELDHSTRGLPLWEMTDTMLTQTGLFDYHAKEKAEKGEARTENLKELVNATKQFDQAKDDTRSPLTAFLDHAALEAGEHQAEEYEDAVQMMTLHSAKGLEFPFVFMAGMEQGLFPSQKSVEEDSRIEEERRLCYVGITRAMRKLYMTYAESRRMYGNEVYNTPSQFLKEIPDALLEEVRLNASVSRPVQFASAASFGLSTAPFKLGQRVKHPLFGEGVVLNCEGDGANARIQVNFAKEGAKWLIAQYAKLEAI